MEDPSPVLEIYSIEQNARLRIDCLGVDMGQLPSVSLHIEIANPGFQGTQPRAWVAASTLEQFVGQLEQLDRSRKGEATLQATSPGEFELAIRSIDSLGHLMVEAEVGRYSLVGNRPTRVMDIARVSFELDPSLLGETLESFRRLSARLI
jgi:hypothetical protein